ncbi:hypothetical protein KDL01_04210 [Actinospica durhamensis]|uniref:Uncharacterized protein n=1 Tax=Actinospica durhamensis TaxID=1508375 RepID=A0A941EJN9_9ACTN|nr:hypothetical protein [Actinospica durhamensis]MBR7832446.1 hypothetical protein [Actinospica durhamensis]
MSTKTSGTLAARASRATHLSLVREPSAVADIPVPDDLPDDPRRAYRLGRLTTLVEALDERTRAAANLQKFESMSFAELEKLIEVLGWFRDAARPSLRLVDERDDIAPIVEAALSEIRPVKDETAGVTA